MLHRWPPRTYKRKAREDSEARWPNVKTWQPSTKPCVPKQDTKSSVAPAVGLWSWAWPLTSLWRVADKKRFSLWGLIKYHIIIWMQLIVSFVIYISACRPFCRNTWWDLVTVSLLYLLGKVCRPKCQMTKKTIGYVVRLQPLYSCISIPCPICYNVTPLSFWVHFCCLATAFNQTNSHTD